MAKDPKQALVLFDVDGFTSIVETSKIIADRPLRKSTRGIFHFANTDYKCELLDLGDTKKRLQKIENNWHKTERAKQLQRTIQARGGAEDGYLDVWPVDDNGQNILQMEETAESTPEGTVDITENSDEHTTQDGAPEVIVGQNDEQADRTEDHTVQDCQPRVIKGQKGRTVNVLFEGEGDYHGTASPNRSPFYTEELSQDQAEILNACVQQHMAGKRSFAVQTDTTVVLQTEAELQEIQASGVTRNDSEKTVCECGDLRKEVELVNKKLDLIVDILNSLKDKNTSATALVDSIMKGSANTTVLELPSIPAKPASKEHAPMEVDVGNQEQENEVLIQEYEDASVLPFLQQFASSPENEPLPYVQLSSSTPNVSVGKDLSHQCFAGDIKEVSNRNEIQDCNGEIRIHPSVSFKVKKEACSVGNFGWRMTRRMYSTEELNGRNYRGRKGKPALSPRRLHAIEHATLDMFGPGDNVRHLSNAVNGALRQWKDSNAQIDIRRPLAPVVRLFNN